MLGRILEVNKGAGPERRVTGVRNQDCVFRQDFSQLPADALGPHWHLLRPTGLLCLRTPLIDILLAVPEPVPVLSGRAGQGQRLHTRRRVREQPDRSWIVASDFDWICVDLNDRRTLFGHVVIGGRVIARVAAREYHQIGFRYHMVRATASV